MARDVKVLVRRIEKLNPEIVVTLDNGHYKFHRGGKLLGVTGSTPSDNRSLANFTAQLLQQGVRLEAVRKQKPKAVRVETTAIQARAKNVLTACGVWKEAGKGRHGWKGTIAEATRVVYWWANEHFPEDSWPSLAEALRSGRSLWMKEHMAPEYVNIWTMFFDDLESKGVVASRYAAFKADMLKARERGELEKLSIISQIAADTPALPVEEEEEVGDDGLSRTQLRRAVELMSYMTITDQNRTKAVELVMDTVERIKPRKRSSV